MTNVNQYPNHWKFNEHLEKKSCLCSKSQYLLYFVHIHFICVDVRIYSFLSEPPSIFYCVGIDDHISFYFGFLFTLTQFIDWNMLLEWNINMSKSNHACASHQLVAVSESNQSDLNEVLNQTSALSFRTWFCSQHATICECLFLL